MPQCQNPTIIECANPSIKGDVSKHGRPGMLPDLPRATCPRPLMALVRKILRKPLEKEEILAIWSLVLCNWSLDPTQSSCGSQDPGSMYTDNNAHMQPWESWMLSCWLVPSSLSISLFRVIGHGMAFTQS